MIVYNGFGSRCCLCIFFDCLKKRIHDLLMKIAGTDMVNSDLLAANVTQVLCPSAHKL